MSKISDWIEASPHKPWCEVASGNIYSSSGPCNCGKQEILDKLSKATAYVLLDKSENTALAISTTLGPEELQVAYLKTQGVWDAPYLSGANGDEPMTGKEAFERGELEEECPVVEVPIIEVTE